MSAKENKLFLYPMHRTLKNFSLLLFLNLFIKATAILIIPVLAKNFSVVEFGMYSLAFTLYNYFVSFSDMGIKTTGIRELNASLTNSEAEKLIQKIIFTRMLLVFLCFIVMNLVGIFLFWKAPVMKIIFIMSIALFPLVLDFSWIHDAKQQMHIQFEYKIIERILFVAIIVWAALIRNIAFAAIAGLFSLSVAGIITIARHYRFSYLRYHFKKEQLVMIRTSMPIGLSAIIAPLYLTIDQFMIKFQINDTALGLFSGVTRLVMAIITFGYVLGYVLFPEISKLYLQNDLLRLKKISWAIGMATTIIYLSGIAIYSFFSKDIILFLLSPEYLEMIPVLDILIWMGLFCVLNIIFSDGLNALRKQKARLYIIITGVILNVCMNFFLIRSMGILGAAYATLFTQIILFSLSITFYFRTLAKAGKVSHQELVY